MTEQSLQESQGGSKTGDTDTMEHRRMKEPPSPLLGKLPVTILGQRTRMDDPDDKPLQWHDHRDRQRIPQG